MIHTTYTYNNNQCAYTYNTRTHDWIPEHVTVGVPQTLAVHVTVPVAPALWYPSSQLYLRTAPWDAGPVSTTACLIIRSGVQSSTMLNSRNVKRCTYYGVIGLYLGWLAKAVVRVG
jgi:hypothetical protein